MILVTFALPFEGRGFAPQEGVSVLYTGIGATQARRVLESRLSEMAGPPALIIAAGFAGGLDPGIGRGNLILDDREPGSGYGDKLRQAGLDVHVGRIHTTGGILDQPEDRLRVYRETGALAVDMETGAIRAVAAERRIPMLGLRVVTDSVAEPLPVPPNVLFNARSGKPDIVRLGGFLTIRPWKIPGMIRFARDCSRASARLAKALQEALA